MKQRLGERGMFVCNVMKAATNSMNNYHWFCLHHQKYRLENFPVFGSNKCDYTKKRPLMAKWMVESQGPCLFNLMFAGGAVLIARLCLTAAKHSSWPKPNCKPMILICPITSFSCFLLTVMCGCVCNSVCVCVCPEKTETSLSLTAASDAAVCASDVFTQRMKWWGKGEWG